MPSIVLHAGMPKAGSSSIQRWLEKKSPALREEGITVAVAPPGDTIRFAPYTEGDVDSSWVAEEIKRSPEKTAGEFAAALAACAEAHDRIVISGEAFSELFSHGSPTVLSPLDELAADHEVRIAYYARPQHTALEAAWCQWGFRSGATPLSYLELVSEHLHFLQTTRLVERLAPEVSFGLRPFRLDRLDSGSLITDFARRFLGLAAPAEDKERMNRGLPLQAVNLLRMAPSGMFWDDMHDNRNLESMKTVMSGYEPAPDERIERSRQVLRRFAFERFGAENEELGWPDFVPPPDDDVPDLEALDQLWSPRASSGELAVLFVALQAAIRPTRKAPGPAPV